MTEVWLVVRAIHLLAMAFFGGGQLFLVAALVPIERRAPDRQRMRAVARRFAWGTLVTVGVLLATGAALATHFGQWGNQRSKPSSRSSRWSGWLSSGTCAAPSGGFSRESYSSPRSP